MCQTDPDVPRCTPQVSSKWKPSKASIQLLVRLQMANWWWSYKGIPFWRDMTCLKQRTVETRKGSWAMPSQVLLNTSPWRAAHPPPDCLLGKGRLFRREAGVLGGLNHREQNCWHFSQDPCWGCYVRMQRWLFPSRARWRVSMPGRPHSPKEGKLWLRSPAVSAWYLILTKGWSKGCLVGLAISHTLPWHVVPSAAFRLYLNHLNLFAPSSNSRLRDRYLGCYFLLSFIRGSAEGFKSHCFEWLDGLWFLGRVAHFSGHFPSMPTYYSFSPWLDRITSP